MQFRVAICFLCLIFGFWSLFLGSAVFETYSVKLDEIKAWEAGLSDKWKLHDQVAKGLKGIVNRDFVANLRDGINGTKAVVQRVEHLLSTAKAMSSNLNGRVDVANEQLKQAWRDTEAHYRMFHTHDRGTSPLIRINLPVSITTRGTRWAKLSDMLLFTSFLPSLLRTMESGYVYGVYVGYDVGDPLLDKPGAEEEVKRLWYEQCERAGRTAEVKLFKYADTAHHNVWAVNYVTKEAYLDGYDYFFRVNDDSEFADTGWTSRLVEALQKNEDFGAAGVLDDVNPRIWTHSFIGRPHLEIFGFHFPFSFGNWWSDDWITFVYTKRFSLWLYDVPIKHHVHPVRYNINWTSHEQRLNVELDRARSRWSEWLCTVKNVTEFCPAFIPRASSQSSIRMDATTSNARGMSLERYLKMENAAKSAQEDRMKRFPPPSKKP